MTWTGRESYERRPSCGVGRHSRPNQVELGGKSDIVRVDNRIPVVRIGAEGGASEGLLELRNHVVLEELGEVRNSV